MKFKGKEESIRKGEKTEEKPISCKIPPVYVGPGRVRCWKHDSALSVNIFYIVLHFIHCSPLWEYLVNPWAPLVSLSKWVSSVTKPPRSWEKVTPCKKLRPRNKSDSQTTIHDFSDPSSRVYYTIQNFPSIRKWRGNKNSYNFTPLFYCGVEESISWPCFQLHSYLPWKYLFYLQDSKSDAHIQTISGKTLDVPSH